MLSLGLSFCLPPEAEQRRIVARVDELMALCDRLADGLACRDALRQRWAVSTVRHVSEDEPIRGAPAWAFAEAHLDTLLAAPEAVPLVRRLVLDLAVRGRLTEQDPNDEPASGLLRRIAAEKQRRYEAGEIRKPKPLAPVTEDEKPFEAPEAWAWTRVGNLFSFGPTNGSSPKAVDYETPVKSLTLSATTSGTFDGRHFKYLDIEVESDSDLWLEPGDVLIQRGNSPEYVGIAALFPGPFKTFVYPDLMMKVRFSEEISTPYGVLVLQSPTARAYMLDRASGTSSSMPKINQGTLRSVPVALPPEVEQRRIVARVDVLMALCDRMEGGLRQRQVAAKRLLAVTLADALSDP